MEFCENYSLVNKTIGNLILLIQKVVFKDLVNVTEVNMNYIAIYSQGLPVFFCAKYHLFLSCKYHFIINFLSVLIFLRKSRLNRRSMFCSLTIPTILSHAKRQSALTTCFRFYSKIIRKWILNFFR